ncbi:MAG TPA: metal ABC transporter permease [Candidatus Hydrogenedentes bacterium]|nr:metal ABC transporter permease [Candidatus Hydrogenedentota bacterium]
MIEVLATMAGSVIFRHALAALTLAGVAGGTVGAYVVNRRLGYIAGGIAHAALGGIGAAEYLRATRGWTWLHPLWGAVTAAILSALLIAWVAQRWREREDTLIGLMWSTGMAVGILLLYLTPGYSRDLSAYLFGNILMAGPREIGIMAGLDLVILGTVGWYFQPFLALCFDTEYARLRGLPAERYYSVLLILVALTVVALTVVAGVVLSIALLTLPAAAAARMARRLDSVMVMGVAYSVTCGVLGMAASYLWNLPSGPVIVLVNGIGYLALLWFRR